MYLILLILNAYFQGTKNIEGIFLNRDWKKSLQLLVQLTIKSFRKINRLRLLIVKYNMVQLSQDFELPCHGLVYFHWDRYPLECLPSNFHADNLVELNLRFSKIKHLWKGNTVLLLFSYIFSLD